MYPTIMGRFNDYYKKDIPNMLQKWIDYDFNYGNYIGDSYETQEMRLFMRDFKKVLIKLISPEYEIVEYHKNYYEVSTVLKRKEDSQLIYLSIPDLRYCKNGWINDILIRTMKHEKDWTGGMNHYADLPCLKEKLNLLKGNK